MVDISKIASKRTITVALVVLIGATALFLSYFAGLFGTTDTGSVGAPKIAIVRVSDFVPDLARIKPYREDMEGRRQEIGLPDPLADRLAERLHASRRFLIVERQALRRVILEQRFDERLRPGFLDGSIDDAIREVEDSNALIPPRLQDTANLAGGVLKDYLDLGSAADADYILIAHIEKMDRAISNTVLPYSTKRITRETVDVIFRLRLLDVKTGIVAGAANFTTQLSQSGFDQLARSISGGSVYDEIARLAVLKVLDIISPATIASVAPLVIDRGAADSLAEGDVFTVFREGKEISDRQGIVVGRLKEKVGEIEIVEIQENLSVARSRGQGDPRQGDLVTFAGESDLRNAASGAQEERGAAPQLIGARRASGIPRIAVGLIKSGSTAATQPEETLDVFTDTLITSLVRTKRFDVADRQEVDQLLDEQLFANLLQNGGLEALGATLPGVDYLLFGNVALFEIEEKQVRFPGLEDRKFAPELTGRVEGNLRIVDVGSSSIVASRQIAIARELPSDASSERILTLMSDAFAQRTVVELLNSVYPIRALDVDSGGTIYINRGRDGDLVAGMEMRIFRLGRELIDPDTSVSMGRVEEPVGRVRLTEVLDATSRGLQIEGEPVQAGDLLRPPLTPRTAEEKKEKRKVDW